MTLHIYGIRHHGPGSARSVYAALESLQPDCILVEGPPDSESMLAWMLREGMTPPVSLLLYVPDEPHRAVYYPFAVFSPEWQALHYGLSQNVTVRFMDLPLTHGLALEPTASPVLEEVTLEPAPSPDEALLLRRDPLTWLAQAAGYSDSERWWEHMVEQRRDSADMFAAINEAMAALRQESEVIVPMEQREKLREAHMRKTIRTAQKEGFERIAVICGAWHAPMLDVDSKTHSAKDDNALLKGLPKVKVESTWVPWTYGRLSRSSGYGAGIESPGWYDYLWHVPTDADIAIGWMSRVARLLRTEDLDASTAQVIDAVRLAESLAAMRDRPVPGLPELNEATRAALCFGRDEPLQLIHNKLIVSETLGSVPDDTPMVPVQQDLQRQQKRLRLQPSAEAQSKDFDLREPNDLERSQLLHRLNLLNIPWGKVQAISGKIKGTFHELWTLQWQPEFAILVIEASVWGNTVYDAAAARIIDTANKSGLPTLTQLVDRVLLANLPAATDHLMRRLEEEAALASDVALLMDALPPLANVQRYGNVRQTDAGMVAHVVDGLVARICIGLPGACASLDDDAAALMFQRLLTVNAAIALLQNADHLAVWHATLQTLSQRDSLHGLIAGRCSRILLDVGLFDRDAVVGRMRLALSPVLPPAQAAAWVEGFLKGSGLVLLHDESLWRALDLWVNDLPAEAFQALLPLLRRTFSSFQMVERRQIGEKVKEGISLTVKKTDSAAFDTTRADAVLPVLAQILGLNFTSGDKVDG